MSLVENKDFMESKLCAIPHPFGPPQFSIAMWKLSSTLPEFHVQCFPPCFFALLPQSFLQSRAGPLCQHAGATGMLRAPNRQRPTFNQRWMVGQFWGIFYMITQKFSSIVELQLLTFVISPLMYFYCLLFFPCLLPTPFLITGTNSQISCTRTLEDSLVCAVGMIQSKIYHQVT